MVLVVSYCCWSSSDTFQLRLRIRWWILLAAFLPFMIDWQQVIKRICKFQSSFADQSSKSPSGGGGRRWSWSDVHFIRQGIKCLGGLVLVIGDDRLFVEWAKCTIFLFSSTWTNKRMTGQSVVQPLFSPQLGMFIIIIIIIISLRSHKWSFVTDDWFLTVVDNHLCSSACRRGPWSLAVVVVAAAIDRWSCVPPWSLFPLPYWTIDLMANRERRHFLTGMTGGGGDSYVAKGETCLYMTIIRFCRSPRPWQLVVGIWRSIVADNVLVALRCYGSSTTRWCSG